ncbi:MAG: hypothetical protein H0U18_17765 [Pyrinomonadaceae bacterium]|nr:hypothetical protein [Pyrinomonadaceae bacterium]
MAESILNALLFKEKPKLPDLPSIDLGKEQLLAISGNASALPHAQSLASATNDFNQTELEKQLARSMPGYAGLRDTARDQIRDMMNGILPGDVSDAVQNSAAARSLRGGFGGSGVHGNLLARDIGRTSLDLIGSGMQAFERWSQAGKQIGTAPMFDVTSMFVTPMQQANFDVSERNQRWNYDWFKEQLRVQPEPWERAVGGLMDWVATTGLNIAGSYAGQLGSGGKVGES